MISRLSFFLLVAALLVAAVVSPGCSVFQSVQGSLSSICPAVRSLARTAEALCVLASDTTAAPQDLARLNQQLQIQVKELSVAVQDLTAVRAAALERKRLQTEGAENRTH